jgi:hypothetical protein
MSGMPVGTRVDVCRIGRRDDVRITLPDGTVAAEVVLPNTGMPAARIIAAIAHPSLLGYLRFPKQTGETP